MEEKDKILTPEEIRQRIELERKWLDDNNAVTETIGGHVEDLQGVPLPADLYQGWPPAHSAGEDVSPEGDSKASRESA